MTRKNSSTSHVSPLRNPRFVGFIIVGCLGFGLVHRFVPVLVQVTAISAMVVVLACLVAAALEQQAESHRHIELMFEQLEIPLCLAPEHQLYDEYCHFARAFRDLAAQKDQVLREFALLKLGSLAESIRELGRGKIVFTDTETWRSVYEKLLLTLDIKSYYSVAWVKTRDYWQDPPAQQSMKLNYDLARRGYYIERIVILPKELWPVDARIPPPPIERWIEEQRNHGLFIHIARQSEIAPEPDLLRDFGIYGDQATGEQVLDDYCRTVQFVLCFDRQSIKTALDRWERLKLFATPYGDLLD